MLGLRRPLTAARPLLVLLLPLLASSVRVGYSEAVDDPDGAKRTSAAGQKLQQIRGALEKLREEIAGAGLSINAGTLTDIKGMMDAVCECDAQLPETLSIEAAHQILAGLDARILAAEQALGSGSDLSAAQVIARKSVLHGMLLQVPPVRNSFSDTVVQLKKDTAPTDLVDPVDPRRKEFTSHYTSEHMSEMAVVAGTTLGPSIMNLITGGGLVGAAMGAIGSTLGLAGLLQATADMEKRTASTVKEEVDLHMIWEPRGALAIDFDDLELVEPAMKMLDEIAAEGEEAARKGMMAKFLRRFGSHVCHKVTLGGTRQMRTTLRTRSSISSHTARLALKRAAQKEKTNEVAGVSKDAPNFGFSDDCGGLEHMVTIDKETTGGAQDLPQGLWTHSLASSENWEIIDRHVRDCTPIWDFVHRDRSRFGHELEKSLFKTWYREFLGLKELSTRHGFDLPEDLATEELLLDWIRVQHELLKPRLELYSQCDATGWCGGHGDCGPETGGVCICHTGYQLHQGTCAAILDPVLAQVGTWALITLAGALAYTYFEDALLEVGRSGGAEWDDSFFYPWFELAVGDDPALRGAGAAHFEEAMKSIVSNAKTEAELVQVMEKTLQGQAALIEIMDHPVYLSRLSQDAEDLATILKLDDAESYLMKLSHGAGDRKAGLEALRVVAASAPVRHSLAVKLSLLAQQLSKPEFSSRARSVLQERTASLRRLIQELSSGGGRREVTKLLASRARQLATRSGPGGGQAADEGSACVPCRVKDALVRRALPLQRQASADLVRGLEELQGRGADPK